MDGVAVALPLVEAKGGWMVVDFVGGGGRGAEVVGVEMGLGWRAGSVKRAWRLGGQVSVGGMEGDCGDAVGCEGMVRS